MPVTCTCQFVLYTNLTFVIGTLIVQIRYACALFITAFVITAEFVIMSILSAQKSADRVFSLNVPRYSFGNNTFWIFVRIASPRRLQIHKTYDFF